MHSSSFTRALVVAMAAVFTAVACGTSSSTNAGSIKILAAWSGQEQASFFAVLKPWEDKTGIKVNYEYSRDLDALLTTRVGAGNPPDLAAAPSPTTLTNFAKQGKVIALDDKIDVASLKSNYSQSWIDLGTINGKLYETFSWVAVKGLIWYDPKNFQAKGYNVPANWQSLLDLQSTIKTGGTTPWCVALESGSASGWPGSDWLKEIVLSQSGPSVYDGWVAGTHMFDNPPKCYMHNQASFITTFFTSANPALQPVTDFNFFPLPDITSQYAGAHVVAGDSWSMFRDTSQARSLMNYLITADAQTIWVKRGGKISPNKQTSLDTYPDALTKESAQILVGTKIAKYDATDQMPADMRAAAWKAVLDFVSDQSKLDSILKTLDGVQATAYK